MALRGISASLLILLLSFQQAWAAPILAPKDSILLSAGEDEDVYDPFADYSEFDEVTEEEADINFFRHGRFATLGFFGGYRTFTEGMHSIFQDSMLFGLYLSYFFDLRFALQLSFGVGTHRIGFSSPTGTVVRGDASISAYGFDLKYYFNTQNVTRGLADFNPYVIGGFSQVYRTSQVSGEPAFAKEGSLGFDLGGGIEIPINRNKMFFGAQLMYQLVNFKTENTEIILANNEHTGIYPAGDFLVFNAILGINF